MKQRVRKVARVVNVKNQELFPTACTGYLWRTKVDKKKKNRGKK